VPLIVTIGEVLWDLLPGGRRPGGAPANCAAHARAAGVDVELVSRVGDDDLGGALVASVRAAGVGVRHVGVDLALPTGTASVSLDGSGGPAYDIADGAAWDAIPFTNSLAALARRADAVCFGTLAQREARSRDTIRRFVAATAPRALRVCDLNLRPPHASPEVVGKSLRLACVLKLNENELATVCNMMSIGGSEVDELDALCDTYDLDVVALTRGERGCRLYARGVLVDHGGAPVEAIDTVGAGDAFTAAFIAGLLSSHALERIAADACRAAAAACSYAGAFPPAPSGSR
jgi:fructokinase